MTGGTSGIGLEVARALCEGGNDVVLTCRDIDKGKEAVDEIKRKLPNALASFMEVRHNLFSCINDSKNNI